jgi:hypothetical protein
VCFGHTVFRVDAETLAHLTRVAITNTRHGYPIVINPTLTR